MEILAFPQASGGALGGEKPDTEGDLWQRGWKEAGELDKASSSSGWGRPTRGMEGAKLDVRVLAGPWAMQGMPRLAQAHRLAGRTNENPAGLYAVLAV